METKKLIMSYSICLSFASDGTLVEILQSLDRQLTHTCTESIELLSWLIKALSMRGHPSQTKYIQQVRNLELE